MLSAIVLRPGIATVDEGGGEGPQADADEVRDRVPRVPRPGGEQPGLDDLADRCVSSHEPDDRQPRQPGEQEEEHRQGEDGGVDELVGVGHRRAARGRRRVEDDELQQERGEAGEQGAASRAAAHSLT